MNRMYISFVVLTTLLGSTNGLSMTTIPTTTRAPDPPTTIPHTTPHAPVTPHPPTTTPPTTTHPTTTLPPPPSPPPTTPPTTPYGPHWTPGPYPSTPRPVYKSSYVIIAPNSIRPSMRFRIGVNVRGSNNWLRLSAEIKLGSKVIAKQSGLFRRANPGRLLLKLPSDLTHGSYKLYIRSNRGLYKMSYLQYQSKRLSMFIQTDKGIYKPGDKVHMRTFGLYPNLKVYTDAMDIYAYDPVGNIIQRWLNQSSTYGVVGKDLQLSSMPILGEWKFVVKTGKETAQKKFKVARYVLPKFEVKVVMPSYALTTQKEVGITVKAKYTFGKPLSGTAQLSFYLLYYHQTLQNTRNLKPFLTLTEPIDGDTDIALPTDKIRAYRKLVVFTEVTDGQTGNVMNATGEVKVYSKGVKLEFPKMNPKTFKPGLEYICYLKVSQPDDRPVALSDKKVEVTITLQTSLLPSGRYHHYGSYHTPTKREVLPVFKLPVAENGLVIFPVPVKKGITKVSIRAKYDTTYAYSTLEKSHSPSNSYLQLLLVTKMAIKAGDDIDFELKSTDPMGQVNYQILSRGELIYTGSLEGLDRENFTFSLRAITHMAPTARVIVYYVRGDGEIVTDTISFEVSGAFRNNMVMELSEKNLKPGEDVRVHIRADPESYAYLLAIDQSVLLLASGNDITSTQVYDELDTYDKYLGGHVNPGPVPFMGGDAIRQEFIRFPYPVFYGGSDASTVFKNAGVIVMTDALVYKYKPPQIHYPYPATMMAATRIPEMMATGAPNKLDSSSGQQGAAPADVRTNFAETWLWTEVKTCANGEASVIASVPDTITSWVASGFAVNAHSGFGMPNAPSSLRVFKPFFISLNLPYSIVMGEQVVLQVVIFNYMDSDQMVMVSLGSSAAYSSVYVDCNGVEFNIQKDQTTNVLVKKGTVVSVFFPIVALRLGFISIEVRAQSLVAADAVRRQLLVEAPGIPHDFNIPVLVDLMGKSRSFQKKVKISLPPETVKGSELVKITAIGDLMGPSISGLEKLLRMPTGCGEQTMLSLAPVVYVTGYLQVTSQLTGALKDKALGYMKNGYQNELRYRHFDGSYSAFQSDKSGSMWLTAFVARVFHQAGRYIFVDPKVLESAVRWMIQKQNKDGSFPEPGRVIHKNMQGQAGSGVSLSAFVYIALLENKDLFESSTYWRNKLVDAQQKTLKYLEDQVSKSEDLYLWTLAVYAFQMAESRETDGLIERLVKRANTTDGLIHWNKMESKKATIGRWHPPSHSSAVDVEMTAYVLMTYAQRKDLSSGRRIMQWLTQQRNAFGGFSSTQDTVVALDAMSQFAELVHSDSFDIVAHCVLDQKETYKFQINQGNALISQRRETKDMPSDIVIDAKGRGLALIEISVFFNVEVDIDDTTFDLNVTIVNQTQNHLMIETCTSWLGDGKSSGMAVQETGVPSGFSADIESLPELPMLRKIETENKKVVLYFDAITTEPLCVQLKMDRVAMVAKVKPSAIKVFDYYEPTNQITAFYHSSVLQTTKMCLICPNCPHCKDQQNEKEKKPGTTPMDEEKTIEMEMNAS